MTETLSLDFASNVINLAVICQFILLTKFIQDNETMEWGFSILRDEDSALKTKSIPFSVHGIKFINCCIRGLRDNFNDVTVYFLQNREIPRPFGGQVYLHSD